MAYDVYPLTSGATANGMGRVGRLGSPQRLGDYAEKLIRRFGAGGARVVGDVDQVVKTAAVCTGSGGSLLGDFFRSGADVFITGDIRYHDARSIEAAGKSLIDLGHFPTEIIFTSRLAERLIEETTQRSYQVTITPCRLETDPFQFFSKDARKPNAR
jgi:putative NIF3 family GTP cyclohydrolase 1 type 2